MSDIMFDACMKFQNYLIRIVGGDAFYSHYIYYNLFQKFKKSPKNQKLSDRQKKHKPDE